MQTLIKQVSQFFKIRAAFVDQKFFEIKTKKDDSKPSNHIKKYMKNFRKML